MTWYVVYSGRVPGVYQHWEECKRQVHRFSGNCYIGFTTQAEAEARYAAYLARERRDTWRKWMKIAFAVWVLVVAAFLFYVIVA